MTRKIFCTVDQAEVEALEFAPLPGELGERVYREVGQPAWQRWLAHQTMLINENRLSPRDAQARAFLMAELQKFLFEGGADKPAGFVMPATDADAVEE